MSAGGRRPRLLAVWLLLVVLVGAIVVIERTDLVGPKPRRDSDGHISSKARLLLPVPVDQLSAIEIVHAGTLHRFERDAAGAWFYHVHGVDTGSEEHHSHDEDPSLAERIEYAFAAFGRTRIERRFALKTQAKEYGVTMPEMIILVYRQNDIQPLAQYAVGNIAPDMLSRYVLVVGSSAMAIIPNYQIDNLLALIEAVAGKSDQGRGTRSLP
jgi:hypothetical protein